MKLLSCILAAFLLCTSALSLPLSARATTTAYLVYYTPLGQSARHWALFLTEAAAIGGASGTVYQVVDDSMHPEYANFRPERRANVVATSAQRYEGSVILGPVTNLAVFDELFDNYKYYFLEEIAAHNQNPLNPQKNCQHWTTDLIGIEADEGGLPAGAKDRADAAPRR